ncbi:MAG: KpsF/GutQ family sugar-phosphate isomerase [Planctomycetota bacterium]
MAKDQDILESARALLAAESQALALLVETLDADFVRAVRLLSACEGRVVTTGIGKAGIIARKVGATLASTGTPSDFLHPAEALHGDLGRVTRRDVVLALSNSGTTEELLRLVGPLKDIGVPMIALTGDAGSPLGRHADVVLDYGRVTEACPLGLAPTTSTTVMLALGDALAMAVLGERQFSPEEFARFHPAGNLGRSLLRVEEVMRKGPALPLIAAGHSLAQAIERMTSTPGRPGAVLVQAADGQFAGFYTDGDLRRNLLEARQRNDFAMLSRPVDEVMTKAPTTVRPSQLVSEAQRLLRERQIDQLPVVDERGRPVGLLDVQDLLAIRSLP